MFELIVVGGGPSGITCAIEAKRYGIEPLLIEKNILGGSLWCARKIENYPPFNQIDGEKLALKFKNLLTKRKIIFYKEEATEIAFKNGLWEIKTSNEKIYQSKTIYVAIGQKEIIPDKYLPFKNEISFPSSFPKNKKVKKAIVFGGGDVGIDLSLKLLENGIETAIFCRVLKAKKALVDEALKTRLKIYEGFILQKIQKKKSNKKAIFISNEGKKIEIEYELLYFALGKKPDFSIFKDKKHIKNSEEKGLFLGGDLINQRIRNVGVAVGDGIKGAFKIFEFLRREK